MLPFCSGTPKCGRGVCPLASCWASLEPQFPLSLKGWVGGLRVPPGPGALVDLHAGCSLTPGASLGVLGCVPGSQKIGVLGAAAAGSGFPGPFTARCLPASSSALSLSTSVTVLTHGCPTQRGSSTSGSGTLGSPSGLGSHLSFLLPPALGGWGEVGATSGALCYLLAPLLSLGLPKWR